MRIVFDIADVWRGGAERVTLDVAARLSDLGHDVLLIVNKRVRHYSEYVASLDAVELGRMSRWDIRVFSDIRRVLKAFDADVCVCVMFNASLWGRLAAASLGIRVVVSEHSTSSAPRAVERLTNLLLGHSTETVIACADAQVESLLRAGHRRCKIRVIRNGVDTVHFSPDNQGARSLRARLALSPHARTVMLVAAHRAEKRHDRFVQLIERLHAAGVAASGIMVGGGPLAEHTKELVKASVVSEALYVTGPIRDMPAVYSAADVVVLLSDDIETFPLALLEAQACETPVVGMDTGGVRETLLDGQTGFIVKQGDLGAMVSIVAALLTDPCRRAKMGRAARRHIVEHLSMESTVRGYLHVLEPKASAP